MIDVLAWLLIILYVFAILFVVIHSLFDAHLIFHYLRSHKNKCPGIIEAGEYPKVTIQLPVYNELHVVSRLIDAVAKIDYPAAQLEIQILDDSTDETTEIIRQKISEWEHKVSFSHIRRIDRTGFKAGALKHALQFASGTFIAVFDADFLPAPDFLKKTIPCFNDSRVGMVQTRWGHVNKNTSILARLQALALDGHFTIEQQGRYAAGYFINFNGTAGVWRKETILDAGNWHADTLTEDLDLSYRAQMKGWQFIYLEDLETPAELPPLISALKSQLFRWTKGGAETARKHIPALLASSIALPVKLHGIFHLIYSFGFVSIIMYALLSVPLVFIKETSSAFNFLFQLSGVVILSLLIYTVHYFIAFYNTMNGSMLKKVLMFLFYFPFFISLFIGLSLNNAIGIVQGYAGIRSPFIRTPKFNVYNDKGNAAIASRYANPGISWVTLAEGVLMVYFIFGLSQAWRFQDYGSLPLLLMASIGFGIIFFLSMQERSKKSRSMMYGKIK